MKYLKRLHNLTSATYGSISNSLNPIYKLPYSKINILLTRVCNERCPFCRVYDGLGSKRDDALTYEEWKKTLGGIPRMTALSFSGGEPTTCPFLFDLIGDVSRRGNLTAIVTNGSFITPEDAPKICDSKLYYMMISLHGTREVHDEVTNFKGGYDKVIKNITAISKYKKKHGLKRPYIGIKTVINDKNPEDLIALCKELNAYDISDIHFNIMSESVLQHNIIVEKDLTSCQGGYGYYKYDKTTTARIKETLNYLDKNKKSFSFDIGFTNKFKSFDKRLEYFGNEEEVKVSKCNIPFYELTLHENGTISPCHSIDLGNLRDINFDISKIKKLATFKNYIDDLYSDMPSSKYCMGCNAAPLDL
ncbi:MAG: MoaA/NifB/PqqE/SkfB family radical SAM enzyme [Bacteriovoracaceae bacterium]|jgi:MoaA/NifB/PqqE/SkfB family radical SAM enzyme